MVSRMDQKRGIERIEALLEAEKWAEARSMIQMALENEPESHWLHTQLGAAYYEQRKYKQALRALLRSRDILPDCPLTLWHLAGTLDALGFHDEAVRLYSWLLRSNKTPEDDPCWESVAWTDTLKTDCVYRLRLCFKHLKQKNPAEYCFRKYLHLLSLGMAGSYSGEDARKQLPRSSRNNRTEIEDELKGLAGWLGQTGEADLAPPELDTARLLNLQEA